MFGIKKVIETAEDWPEMVRVSLLALINDIERGDLAEKIGEDFARGVTKGLFTQLREEFYKSPEV